MRHLKRFSSRKMRRAGAAIAVALVPLLIAHGCWQPGQEVRDGRHDRGQNALWLEHGWLGDDAWFRENNREAQKPQFRSLTALQKLARQCAQNGIRDVYPHLCPTQDGAVAGVDHAQVERFLNAAPHLRVLPWIGGRLDGDVRADSSRWRASFVASVGRLLRRHPRLAGVHLNIEPCRNGNRDALALLDDLRPVLRGKTLSVSAYPPRDWYWPFKAGWSQWYFVEVARRCDQMTIMAYDSSLHDTKVYQWSMANWTQTTLQWTSQVPHPPHLLMGVPTYANAGTWWGATYHNSRVESLSHALAGIHSGLSRFDAMPPQFQGIAIYSAWETDASEWKDFRTRWRGATPARPKP